MMEIPIKGKTMLIDEEDYDFVAFKQWYIQSEGYVCHRDHTGTHYLHRFLMRPPDGLQVDHINGDKLDNRRCNLRLCTNQQNSWNIKNNRKKKTSLYRGVYWYERDSRWVANLCLNYKTIYLGRFDNELEAAQAYDTAVTMFRGEYASPNLVEQLEALTVGGNGAGSVSL